MSIIVGPTIAGEMLHTKVVHLISRLRPVMDTGFRALGRVTSVFMGTLTRWEPFTRGTWCKGSYRIAMPIGARTVTTFTEVARAAALGLAPMGMSL